MRLADIDYRRNSIGFLRLFFAALVIFSHGYGLGGFNPADEPVVSLSKGEWSLGTVAVCGFFFLSGFLVTKSYDGLQSLPHFIWHRVLRIFPGFWCCLLVTAFAFAPLLYYFEHHTLTGFWSLAASDSALGFLTHNYTLDMYQFDVMGVTKQNPYALGLNGSLWTLGNEFRCYIVLAVLGVTGILSRSRILVLVILAALWAISVSPALGTALVVKHPMLLGIFERSYQFEEMFVYFFLGAAAYLYRDRIPVRTLPFALAAVALFAILPFPWFRLAMPALLGYCIVWLMCRLPIRSIDRHFDLSYGVYIYAFPVQQSLTYFGLNRFGFVPYIAFCTLATAPLAAASWFGVESQALRWKKSAVPTHAALLFDRYAGRPLAAATRGPRERLRRAAERTAARAPDWRPALHGSFSRRTALALGIVVAAMCAAAAAVSYRSAALHDAPAKPANEIAGSGRFVPAGVNREGDLSVQTNGIFTGRSREECCWLSPSARFRADAPRTAAQLVLHLYVPDLPYLRSHPESLRARLNGRLVAQQNGLAPGAHVLALPLRGSAAGAVQVELDSGPPWSGADLGINGDRRKVTVLLQAVSFQ
jgi:peptidoglycan/LPS O-acetylase OafA/YrhL